MIQKRFILKKILRSFIYAFKGLNLLLREEHNVHIHIFSAICVIIAGFAFEISFTEWIAVVFAIGIVFITETFNTAIERISDFVSPVHHKAIGQIKDLSAAAVLIGSMVAFIIGLIIFIPKIFQLNL